MKILRFRFFKNKKKIILVSLILLTAIFIVNTRNINKTNEDSLFINNKKSLKSIFITKPTNSSFKNDNCFSAFDNLNEINLNLYKTNKKSNCSTADWVLFDYKQDHAVLIYNYDYLTENDIKIENCKYATVDWYKNDFEYKLNEMVNFENGTIVKAEGNLFIYIACNCSNSTIQYKTAYARILKKNEPIAENHKSPINVFMLGFDSVSRKLWLENLPKSTNYLVNTLKSTILNGYNIFGDGTPAAVCFHIHIYACNI